MTDVIELPTADELRRRGSVKWTAFPEAVGAFVAEMDFGVAPPVAEALTRAIADGLTGYLPARARTDLQQATAAWSADRYAWSIAPDDVRPVADVLSGLHLFLTRFTDPSKPVIVPTPGYMPFLRIPQAVGRPIIEVPSTEEDGRYALDLDGIDAAFRAGADALVLCNPWNPTGRVLSREELLALAEVVDRHGGRVFADEVHAPLVFPGHPHVPYASLHAAAAAHTVTALSASKAFNLPGLKCAQLVFSADGEAARFDEVAGFAAAGASTFGVLANTAAYTDGGTWLDEALAYLDRSRTRVAELLVERLPAVRFRPPEGTYIGWLDARALDLGREPATAILERAGVALTDGAACGEAGRGYLRMILATPLPVLEDAVARLGDALD